MSMWKQELEDFSWKWVELAERFERDETVVIGTFASETEAEAFRFEWYAFKNKLRRMEADKPSEERMFQKLPHVRAELGQMVNGRFAVRFILRDVTNIAKALDEMLTRTPEETAKIEFVRTRKTRGA